MIPKPFTRVVFAYGAPIVVPKEASDEEMAKLRAIVQKELDGATLRAEQALSEDELWKA